MLRVGWHDWYHTHVCKSKKLINSAKFSIKCRASIQWSKRCLHALLKLMNQSTNYFKIHKISNRDEKFKQKSFMRIYCLWSNILQPWKSLPLGKEYLQHITWSQVFLCVQIKQSNYNAIICENLEVLEDIFLNLKKSQAVFPLLQS